MSLKVESAYFNPHRRSLLVKKVVSSSVLGYIAGRIFSLINPLSAVVFNLTAEITHHFISALFEKTSLLKNSKLTRGFIKSFISFSAAFVATNLICKFTLIQAFKVTAFTLITQIALAKIFGLVVLMGGFAIFVNMGISYAHKKLKSLKA
ncbi:MAG: hypothetical protein K940chlam5_01627 [Candidatus Anoxychlamydiales bacterium]|nr:hypothetical protein [Candidatus Anoxychlamydiales bacterium]